MKLGLKANEKILIWVALESGEDKRMGRLGRNKSVRLRWIELSRIVSVVFVVSLSPLVWSQSEILKPLPPEIQVGEILSVRPMTGYHFELAASQLCDKERPVAKT